MSVSSTILHWKEPGLFGEMAVAEKVQDDTEIP